jgi:isoquinoline 1-oxidoreductase beta subunit
VHRVVAAIDCGPIVNPDIIAAQIESAVVFGLTAALYGEITVENGRVVQGNFDTYPLLQMAEMPVVETHIVPSTDAQGGVGEPATPPIAPAVANALATLTGKRVRRLPLGQAYRTA